MYIAVEHLNMHTYVPDTQAYSKKIRLVQVVAVKRLSGLSRTARADLGSSTLADAITKAKDHHKFENLYTIGEQVRMIFVIRTG